MIKGIVAWGIVSMFLISFIKWLISNDNDSKPLSEWWEDED